MSDENEFSVIITFATPMTEEAWIVSKVKYWALKMKLPKGSYVAQIASYHPPTPEREAQIELASSKPIIN